MLTISTKQIFMRSVLTINLHTIRIDGNQEEIEEIKDRFSFAPIL